MPSQWLSYEAISLDQEGARGLETEDLSSSPGSK